eukprot:TRINITY_DN25495_c0_g1_i1.p1 TRINITY_DN25495_c0_g1~~TRINITY_DN25495_c0_g1_i1.p1  ORF type:complete len:457 (-),score=54.36 TRINITY_DN25495_c0_g1_i1:1139-2431(-)
MPQKLCDCLQEVPDEFLVDTSSGDIEVTCVATDRSLSWLLSYIAKRTRGNQFHLSKLDLHKSHLSSSGLCRVANFLQAKGREAGLRELNFSSAVQQLAPSACVALATALGWQPHLDSLSLSHIGLTPMLVPLLAPALAAPLRTLDLSGNQLGDQGALKVLRLRHPTLHKLYMHGNDVSREIIIKAHPYVCETPNLVFLSIFSLENDVAMFKDAEVAERMRKQQESRRQAEERVVQEYGGSSFFRPTIDDSFLCYRRLNSFDAATGDCGIDHDTVHYTWVFPRRDLPAAQWRSGTRCIAEYHTGNKTSAYVLCEIHQSSPLQVLVSSRVVSPTHPDQFESRAFNRLLIAAEEEPTSSSSSTSRTPSPAPTIQTAGHLTGRLFECPAALQTSYAEKSAAHPHDDFPERQAYVVWQDVLDAWGPAPCSTPIQS